MPRKEFDRLIVWLRRDLRLEDNVALTEAIASSHSVIPLFVLDDKILSRPDIAQSRIVFMLSALACLDQNLRSIGGRLVIRRGSTPDQIVSACYEYEAQGVFFQDEYEPFGRNRDRKAVEQLRAAGKSVRSFPGLTYATPSSITSQAGTPYTVFTPYKRIWFETPQSAPLRRPSHVRVPDDVPDTGVPTAEGLGVKQDQTFSCGGEDAALDLLKLFQSSKSAEYPEARNLVSVDGTSHLSSHLHFGTISPRKIIRELSGPGNETFLSELAWRDFYMQILYNFPYVENGPFKRQFEKIKWHDSQAHFEAWCGGKTGYPIVDAAMRQLNSEAWMHNRARMIVASFLTKDLLINWQQGERYFMQKLVDGDLAANNGGWQWSAGTGTDAQPYFRIFNPITQGEKFDPDGVYVKKYVPELSKVPAKFVHSPWKMSPLEQEYCGCVVGKDYPERIVDHVVQRSKAMELYRSSGVED